MKKIMLALALCSLTASGVFAQTCSKEGPTRTYQDVVLDKADATISLDGEEYRYVLSERAQRTRLNPPGKSNIVDVTGYLLQIEGAETVFVITAFQVTGFQG